MSATALTLFQLLFSNDKLLISPCNARVARMLLAIHNETMCQVEKVAGVLLNYTAHLVHADCDNDAAALALATCCHHVRRVVRPNRPFHSGWPIVDHSPTEIQRVKICRLLSLEGKVERLELESAEVRPGTERTLEDGCAVFEFSSAATGDSILLRWIDAHGWRLIEVPGSQLCRESVLQGTTKIYLAAATYVELRRPATKLWYFSRHTRRHTSTRLHESVRRLFTQY